MTARRRNRGDVMARTVFLTVVAAAILVLAALRPVLQFVAGTRRFLGGGIGSHP